jgi:hypothetical protein
MNKKTSNLPLFAALLILLSTFSLAGCYLLRPTGPCFGVGCPARPVGENGQYKKGEGPKSQTASAQNKDSQPAQPAQKSGNFFTNAFAKITRSR